MSRIIDQMIQVMLLTLFFKILVVATQNTDPQDFAALRGLMDNWQNTPPDWVGTDPCGSKWTGISCTNSRVTSITLSNMNLKGTLSGDILKLTQLQTLDLSSNAALRGALPAEIGRLTNLATLALVGCSFNGVIPDSLGSLKKLTFLALNSNGFSGWIPPSIGNLTNLSWLDLADNQLEGPIPVSNSTSLGLDMLVNTLHFHLGNNKLSGQIPDKLFSSNMSLIHVLFDSNQLTGTIPQTLGLVKTLEAVRLDRNQLSGTVPSNINELSSLTELYLSNNNFNGSIPDLSGMSQLIYVDMSNNTFNASTIPSWFSTLQSMTTLVMEHTGLQGPIPVSLFNLSNLQSVVLSNNKLSGSVDIGTAYSSQLQLIDLRGNSITDLKQTTTNITITLFGNPICLETGVSSRSYCQDTKPTYSYSTPSNCGTVPCNSNQISSPNCKCAYPYTGTLFFRALGFSNHDNSSYYVALQQSLMKTFQSQNNLPVDSVALINPFKNDLDYFGVTLQVFPSQADRFNRTAVSTIAFVLSNQIFKPPEVFSPYYYIGNNYDNFLGEVSGTTKSSNAGVIAGAVVGGTVLLLLVGLLGVYAFRKKRNNEKSMELNPFVHWNSDDNNGNAPQLKAARWFSFEELKKYTNNFSDENDIGAGGYGKVYCATLPTGEAVAIKRARQESMQGAHEFKTEIELLSRVHHKNLVSLKGFCFEKGEQILVYEYIPNGTLMEAILGKSHVQLDWVRRLRAALGAARGLAYLHELANPPIIHRDVKSGNILLDEHLNAKVADFGLSKPLTDTETTHVTTQVKGTMGYMDPEYYMTNQLTDKSDVYSFGVVVLELVTGRKPIEHGTYIVREVSNAMDRSKKLYNLHDVIDPYIRSSDLKGLERFVDLAMRCVDESAVRRPSMAEVVKEIEDIIQLLGLIPSSIVESTSTSETNYKVLSIDDIINDSHPDFSYSGGFPSRKVEPH